MQWTARRLSLQETQGEGLSRSGHSGGRFGQRFYLKRRSAAVGSWPQKVVRKKCSHTKCDETGCYNMTVVVTFLPSLTSELYGLIKKKSEFAERNNAVNQKKNLHFQPPIEQCNRKLCKILKKCKIYNKRTNAPNVRSCCSISKISNQ